MTVMVRSGGLGKTTMAKKLQAELLGPGTPFQRSAFVTLDFQEEAQMLPASKSECRAKLRDCIGQLTGSECSDASDRDLKERYESELRKGRVLLVLDNFHTLTQLDSFMLNSLLADTSSAVIVTSRHSKPVRGADVQLRWAEVCGL
jgi:hypothetical protein